MPFFPCNKLITDLVPQMLFVGIQESSRNSLQDRKHNKGKAGKPSKSVVQPGNRCQSVETTVVAAFDRWFLIDFNNNSCFPKDEQDGEVEMLRNTSQRCLQIKLIQNKSPINS